MHSSNNSESACFYSIGIVVERLLAFDSIPEPVMHRFFFFLRKDVQRFAIWPTSLPIRVAQSDKRQKPRKRCSAINTDQTKTICWNKCTSSGVKR